MSMPRGKLARITSVVMEFVYIGSNMTYWSNIRLREGGSWGIAIVVELIVGV